MELEDVIKILTDNSKPYSIFLYGSKATFSDNKDSDCELGIIYEENNYVSRKVIEDLIKDNNYSIFPFKLKDVLNYDIDTPFQKNIYITTLINGGAKTIYGEKVLETLNPPNISIDDLLADINFHLGIALSSVKVYKTNNMRLANELFYKSCFYSTRDLIYSKTKELCISYNEIYKKSQNIDIPNEYRELLEIAYKLRNEKLTDVESVVYFKNITYINKFILKHIV